MFSRNRKKMKILGRIKMKAYLKGRKDQKNEDTKKYDESLNDMNELLKNQERIHNNLVKTIHEINNDEVKREKIAFEQKIALLRDEYNRRIENLKLEHKNEKEQFKKHLEEKEEYRTEEYKKLKKELVDARKEADAIAQSWQAENIYLKEIFETFFTTMNKVASHVSDISKIAARIAGPDKDIFLRLHQIVQENEVRVSQYGPQINDKKRKELP